jgi:phospholipid/cholesterol/gamma-HCH transport system substrate-binding protein
METKASHIAVGAFVLVLLFAALGFVIWVGHFSQSVLMTDYYIRFSGSVAGLDVNSNVLFGGIPVGHVTSVEVDPKDSSLARVDIAVKSDTPIHTDSEATLAMQGITGGVLIEITRGSALAARQKPDTEIRSGYSALERLFAAAPELVSKSNMVLDSAAKFLSSENAAVVARVLGNLDKLTGKLASSSESLDGLLREAENTIRQANATAVEIQKLASDLRGSTGKLTTSADKAVEQIRGLATTFNKTAENLNGLIQENRQPIHDFASTGLYDLSQMITEVRLLAQTLNRVSLEIERDPARFLFGDRQKGFEASQ